MYIILAGMFMSRGAQDSDRSELDKFVCQNMYRGEKEKKNTKALKEKLYRYCNRQGRSYL